MDNQNPESGISMVSTMVALGLAGGLSMIIASSMRQMYQGERLASQNLIISGNQRSMEMLVSNPNSCKASIGGMQFRFSAIDFAQTGIGSLAKTYQVNSEGLNIRLFNGDGSGNRTALRFKPGIDPQKKGLNIKALRLVMPNQTTTCGGNLCAGTETIEGAIVAVTSKKIGDIERNVVSVMPVFVATTTDASGLSTIDSCSSSYDQVQTFLHFGEHSTNQCTMRQGQVVTDPTLIDPNSKEATKFCRLNMSSCPTGWIQYREWSETVPGPTIFVRDDYKISEGKFVSSYFRRHVHIGQGDKGPDYSGPDYRYGFSAWKFRYVVACMVRGQKRSCPYDPRFTHTFANIAPEFSECQSRECAVMDSLLFYPGSPIYTPPPDPWGILWPEMPSNAAFASERNTPVPGRIIKNPATVTAVGCY